MCSMKSVYTVWCGYSIELSGLIGYPPHRKLLYFNQLVAILIRNQQFKGKLIFQRIVVQLELRVAAYFLLQWRLDSELVIVEGKVKALLEILYGQKTCGEIEQC